jgi:hypothetical protein
VKLDGGTSTTLAPFATVEYLAPRVLPIKITVHDGVWTYCDNVLLHSYAMTTVEKTKYFASPTIALRAAYFAQSSKAKVLAVA